MGGGLMQLVAYGAQDIYLTGNPQITFFKVVYRRHTNFSMESIQQTLNGTVGSSASTVTATISRNGDLLSHLYLDVKMAAQNAANQAVYANWCNNTGHSYIKEVELEIGGQRIDKHYGTWLDIYNELTDHSESEHSMLNKHKSRNAYLKGCVNTTQGGLLDVSGFGSTKGLEQTLQLHVPLKFWFCRNPGLALPLIALQYHEVKVKMSLRGMAGLVNADTVTITPAAPTVKLWADYIYLDTDERRRFAQVSHEYLIEQLQQQTDTLSSSVKLNFNHPVKELVWVVQHSTAASENTAAAATTNTDVLGSSTTGDQNEGNYAGHAATAKNDYLNYSPGAGAKVEYVNGQRSLEAFDKALIQLNGHDRFTKRTASYFRTVQPAQHGHRVSDKHIYCYSFALKPEEHQPSGTCNFSRIDNAQLKFDSTQTTTNCEIKVYAVNYNVLRIMSGMGGLAYSN